MSGENALPFCALRIAYNLIKSRAISFTFFLVLFFSFSQASVPSLCVFGTVPSLPLYLEILFKELMLTYKTFMVYPTRMAFQFRPVYFKVKLLALF